MNEEEEFEFRLRMEQEQLQGSPPPPEPQTRAEKARASWREVITTSPQYAMKGLANAILRVPTDSANLAQATAGFIGGQTGLLKPDELPGANIEPFYQIPNPRPENMDSDQEAAFKAIEFGTLGAVAPGQMVKRGALDLARRSATSASMAGAAGGAGHYAGEASGSPMVELAVNLATPLALSATGGLTGWMAQKGGDAASLIPMLRDADWAQNRLVRNKMEDWLANSSVEEKKLIIDALRARGVPVEGTKLTTGDLITAAQMGLDTPVFGSRLIRAEDELSRASDIIPTRRKENLATMAAPLEAAGGGTPAQRQGLLTQIDERIKNEALPLMREGQDLANVANQRLPGLLSDQAAAAATRANARQQEGQMRTTAAQMENATVPRPPVPPIERGLLGEKPPTVSQSPGQFPETRTAVPQTLQRIPEGGITGQALAEGAQMPINRVAKLRAAEQSAEAADEFGQIGARAADEFAEAEARIANLAFDGFKPLTADAVQAGLDELLKSSAIKTTSGATKVVQDYKKWIAELTDQNGTLDAREVGMLRANLNADLTAFFAKERPGVKVKGMQDVGTGIKFVFDEAIKAAGGDSTKWEKGLAKYSEIMTDASRIKLAQELRDALTDKTNTETAKRFLKLTDPDNEKKLLRSVGAPEKAKSVRDLVGDQQYQQILKMREQLLIGEKRKKIAGGVNSMREPNLTPPQAPGLFSQPITILNSGLLRLSETAMERMNRNLARAMTDPNKVANYVEKSMQRDLNRRGLLDSTRPVVLPGLLNAQDE